MKIDLKRKEVICTIIILLIVVAIAPGINANILNKKIEGKEEPTCLGSIYGHTGISDTWGFSPIRIAKVETGGKTIISGPIMGEYRIRGLPLGKYIVTGSKKGYDTFTDTATLTERYPDKQVFIHLEPNDESVKKANIRIPMLLRFLENHPILNLLLQN